MKSLKIVELINKINRIFDNTTFPAVSKIERDLLKHHIRDLYEEVDGLETTTAPLTQNEAVQEIPPPVKRPIIRPNDNLLIQEEPAINNLPAPAKIPAVEIKKDTPPSLPEVEPENQVPAKVENRVEAKIETRIETRIEKTVQSVTSTINESIKSVGSLNEKLKTSSTEMHKKLASKPLRELIDLNKKFVLLNELFKGNTEAYSAAIAHIDTLNNHEAAQSFINNQLISNYAWDESKQSTRMFLKLVKLKFGVE